MKILWSIGAVFAGLVTVVVLSEGTDFLLRSAGIYPPLTAGVAGFTDQMFLGAFAYRTLAGVIGGFVAASLAPANNMAHAMVLGIIGTALGTAGAIMMWGVGPAWYPTALAIVALPASWLGGWLQARGKRAQA
jgi:hypothetical protein